LKINKKTSFGGKLYSMREKKDGVIILTPENTTRNNLRKKRAWANEILSRYCGQFIFIQRNRIVVALCKNEADDVTGDYWGMAVCRECDEFDESIGRAIAIMRVLEEEIPDFVLN
jgi:hypothetical protein